MHNDELLYKIALTKVDRVGPVLAKALLSHFGSAEQVFKAKKQQLTRIPQIGVMVAESIKTSEALGMAEKELEYIRLEEISLLDVQHDDYPSRLKVFPDSPLILYYRGTADLNAEKVLAVVGTRNITEYGKDLVHALIRDLKSLGLLVISGLAYGVDSVVHRTCLQEALPTVGVLGHGLGRMYPAVHAKLAKQMTAQGGLLTEFGFHTKPDRENFPMRNRIVAGMCDALVVVETKKEGGSMITATYANQYNKDVFAFPGKTTDPYSNGCHHLIKTHQARLIENAEDLVMGMMWDVEAKPTRPVQQKLFLEFSGDERKILETLQKENICHVDQLLQSTELRPGQLASLLLELEFQGLLKALPGKRFALV